MARFCLTFPIMITVLALTCLALSSDARKLLRQQNETSFSGLPEVLTTMATSSSSSSNMEKATDESLFTLHHAAIDRVLASVLNETSFNGHPKALATMATSSSSSSDMANATDESLFTLHHAAIDRVLASVPSPGNGH